jgi:hypothetical protein
MNSSNTEAWEVYQMVGNEQAGITAQGIEAACELLQVEDPTEIYLKVTEISKRVRMFATPVGSIKE